MASLSVLRPRRTAPEAGDSLSQVHAEKSAGVRAEVRARTVGEARRQAAAARSTRSGTTTAAAGCFAARRASRTGQAPPSSRRARPRAGVRLSSPATLPSHPPTPQFTASRGRGRRRGAAAKVSAETARWRRWGRWRGRSAADALN